MLELDEVVRQNQVACLPFSKSGRAEAELFERYPELFDTVERGRRAKIDSFRLQSRLRDEESYYASTGKARPISRDGTDNQKPPRNMTLKAPEHDGGGQTPSKPHNREDVELMFQMEEEEDDAPQASTKSNVPLHVRTELFPADELQALSSSLAATDTSNSPHQAVSSDILGHSAQGSSWMSQDLHPSHQRPAEGAKVWASSGLGSSRLDMKEIMAQDSFNKVSSLSSALTHKASTQKNATNSQTVKLSQKERKRQQQQQQQLPQDSSLVMTVSINESEPIPAPKPFPWRHTSRGEKVSLQDVLRAESNTYPPPSPEQPRRESSKSSLTMRQTVPGNVAASQRSASGDARQTPMAIPTRKMSNLTVPSKIPPAQTPSNINTTSVPTIRSIRHGPPPVEPSLQLSMADILAQQQTEKQVVKDAVAKRSLQEIQEEQAFQEWWDQESKKVREEEEKTKDATVGSSRGRAGNGRRARGTSKGRGRGTGKGTGPTNETQSGGGKEPEAKAPGSRGESRQAAGKRRPR